MKHPIQRALCLLLCLILTLQLAEPAAAVWQEDAPTPAQSESPVVLRDSAGNEVTPDESWEEVYPYGAFGFDVTAADAREGDDTVVTVYRAGGTKGKATAYIVYSPLLVPNEDGSTYYGYALSGRDLTLEVEDPLPIAAFQPVGKPADPEPCGERIEKTADEQGYVLTLAREAEHYQWEILYDGRWCAVGDSDKPTLAMDAEYMGEDYDYRCVYTADGVRYCTDSLKGLPYEKPAPEAPEPVPADLELSTEQTFTAIALDDEEDPYSGWVFGLTFAEGEWKKEIRLHANTDDASEAMEGATMRISYTDGGEIYAGAETLLYHVADGNESNPSTVGFRTGAVTADKADGTVEIPVRREGAVERPVSVEYRTVDGTAKAGTDYVAASGTLMLYGNVTELPVKVELIDAPGASDETLEFSVELFELKGDDNCTLTAGRATVSLTDLREGQSADNLATLLHDGQAVDLTEAVADAPTAANAGSETVTGEQVTPEEPVWEPVDLIPLEDGGMSTQVYSFPVVEDPNNPGHYTDLALLNFGSKGDWEDTEDLAKVDLFDTSKNISKVAGGATVKDVGNKATSGGYGDHVYDSEYETYNGGVVAYGKASGWIGFTEGISNPIGQMYSDFEAKVKVIYAHDETWYKVGTTNDYRGSWLDPQLVIGTDKWDSKDILQEPRDTRIEIHDGDYEGNFCAAGSKNWNVQGKSSTEDKNAYSNPYEQTYSGTITTTGPVGVALDFSYHSTKEHCTDTLLHNSLLELQYLKMTRRMFSQNAFTVDIATPNDESSSPDGCMVISDYSNYVPSVSFLSGAGGAVNNRVYVGSTICFKSNDNIPPGLFIARVDVFCSDDNGATWKNFNDRFQTDVSMEKRICNVKLLGKKGKELSKEEIENYHYRFRLVYQRDQMVKVDLTPSLPRDDNGNVQTDEIDQLFNNYAPMEEHIIDYGNGAIAVDRVRGEPTQDHCFGDAHITYGYSTYDQGIRDFSKKIVTEAGPAQPDGEKTGIRPDKGRVKVDSRSETASWYLPKGNHSHGDDQVANIQWINFGLPKSDELVINGRSYKGNETIYFTEGDLAGDIIIKYYHSAYKYFINTMTTDLSWMRLYLDADGNDQIDGAYNEHTGAFVLDSDHGDRLIRDLRQGESFSELEVEPVELEGGGTGQYFVQACYSMTPRCIAKPEGPEKDSKAQVLGAITSAVDPGSSAYSEQTAEQKEYNYVISGKDPDGRYTSDDHPMYEAIASAKTVLSLPLGGDKNPGYVTEVDGAEKYIWEPLWYENNLYACEQPDLITIENTPAGPTHVTQGAELNDEGKYEYTASALRQMNGYLASLRGTSTFVLVSQVQAAGIDAIRHSPKKYPVVPDSVTMSRVSTSPDGSYLQENHDAAQSEMTMPTGGEDSEMPEFNMPFDINLGDNEIGITDYVSIILGENQIGFAVSIPLLGYEREGSTKGGWQTGKKKNPKVINTDFFESLGNFGSDVKSKNKKLGDESYQKSLNEHSSTAPDKAKAIGCGKVSATLSVAFAFVWQYNPLDNGYYFSTWEIGVEGELGFRGQVRLTVCPVFYGFLDVKFSLELKTGLGVIRDTRHAEALINAKTPQTEALAVTKRYYAEGKTITQSEYEELSGSEQEKYVRLSTGKYAVPEEALARRSFLLTEEQYGLLDEEEKADYHLSVDGYYVNKRYNSLDEAKAALLDEQTYTFELGTKAFDVRFDGKLYMEVQEKNSAGRWVKAAKDSGFISGVLSSDGTRDTLVVIRQQDEMELKKPVRIALRALEYNGNTNVDSTKITYVAPVDDIYNQVHWNGIKLAPELSVEIGVGVGVEVLRAEVYLHISLGAEFLLWGFNPKYDPTVPEYLDEEETKPNPTYQDKYYCRVDNFDFTIGLALRVVLVVLTYELDMVSYQVHYEASGKSVNDAGELFKDGEWSYEWHFLNDLAEQDADDPDAGVTVRLPKNMAFEQQVFSPEDNEATEENGLSTQAFDPKDPTVPFQTSGYGCSMDSANLTSGIPEGGSYKVVRAGEKNYIVYTLSRQDSTVAPEDSAMLVMSELGWNGNEYGLVNPNGSGTEPYIVLDREAKATGDLDFDAWADGATVRAAWVSYGSPAEAGNARPAKPAGLPAADANGKTINADNYPEFSAVPGARAWYEYYLALESYNAYLQQRAKTAAQNTVVKTASWSPAGTSFTEPAELFRNDDYSFVFQPSSTGSGDAVFFASTAWPDVGGAALDRYKEYLQTKKLDRKVRNYLTAMKKGNLDLLGTQSALNLAVKTDDGWTVSQTALQGNQTLANVDFAAARDGAYYVAYTTEQSEYTDGDMVTVYRMYLRRVKEKDGEIIWGNAFLIRELRDFDQDRGGVDGVYSGGALMAGREYDSPYLSNLKFLTGNLDTDILTGSGTGESLSTQAVREQTLLSFEMNGASYLIPEDTLESITGGAGGMIYPFFTPPVHENADGSTVAEGASGKLGVDINSDDGHNLYAVYMGAVEGTTGNALYMSAYDASVGRWGDGTMLAMHDMNTWEAAVRMDLDRNERELAYLYGSDELRAQEEALTAMYGQDVVTTVKQMKAAEDADSGRTGSDLGDGQTFTFSDVQTVKGAKDGELLAVTQGSLKPLSIASYTDGRGNEQYVLTPKYDGDGLVSTRGTYVVSFGQGSAALGSGKILFAEKDFSRGSRLNVTVLAENVGTSAFRGSENQPITAELKADGQTLAAWKIKENVYSGQAIELSGDCSPLAHNLAEGNEFTLVLSEYTDENGVSPYNGVTDALRLFTVEKKPDLSVEDLTIMPASVTDDGAGTNLSVEFVAANHGSEEAKNVYAQFSYVSGYDDGGEPIYSPLPLTDSDLQIGVQESLGDLLKTQEAADEADRGVIFLYSDDGTGRNSNSNIRDGYGKRVKGSIRVPSAVFCADESKHAQIRVELFSDASAMTTQEYGVDTAVNDEYCTVNNASERQVEAFTSFSAAHAIVIPLGTTTKIPVSAVSARNTRPVIALEEIGDEDGRNIGILSFRQSRARQGLVSGAISITPVATGSGVLHVTDTDTNTTFSVAFEVTEAGSGIDIHRDNEAFSFYNRNDSRYDQNSANPASQNWGFANEDSWGTGQTRETPMRGNLATGEQGTYFTFDTVAESIDLYFQGEVTVTSTNPEFAKINNGRNVITITNETGGNAPVRIELGGNERNETFRVTVTVVGKSAVFDRMTERYSGNVAPIPAYDGASPLLIWSRSFPDTGSVVQGTVPLKLYILDNNGIAGLTVNGRQITDPQSEENVASLDPDQLLWCYDFGELSHNDTFSISAVDVSGNVTATTLEALWFLSTGSDPNGTVSVPPYTAGFRKDGKPLPDAVGSTDGLEICFEPDTADPAAPKLNGNTFEVYYFDGTGFNKMSASDSGTFAVSQNGIYWTRVLHPGADSGTTDDTWSAEVLNLRQIDKGVLQASLAFNGSDTAPALHWSAIKNASVAKVSAVTINGWPVTSETGTNLSGRWPIRFNGVYRLRAEDSVTPPRVIEQEIDVTDVKIREHDGLVSVTVPTDEVSSDGAILLDAADLVGGSYDSAQSVPAQNIYYGKYKALLLPPADAGRVGEILASPDAADGWIPLEKGAYTHAWTGLPMGDYSLLIMDDGDGGRAEGAEAPTNCLVKTVSLREKLDKTVFVDVRNENAFYFEPVYWAFYARPQITNGIDETHFGPERGCTRGQVVTFLWRAAGCPEPGTAKTGFTDLKPGAFYEKAVAWAVENEITNGMTPTAFAPDATCTRGQIVTFLWRFAGKAEPKRTKTDFTDVSESAFYAKAVAWAVEEGVTNGMTPTAFAPSSTCTRGQVVTFLYRAMDGK